MCLSPVADLPCLYDRAFYALSQTIAAPPPRSRWFPLPATPTQHLRHIYHHHPAGLVYCVYALLPFCVLTCLPFFRRCNFDRWFTTCCCFRSAVLFFSVPYSAPRLLHTHTTAACHTHPVMILDTPPVDIPRSHTCMIPATHTHLTI